MGRGGDSVWEHLGNRIYKNLPVVKLLVVISQITKTELIEEKCTYSHWLQREDV